MLMSRFFLRLTLQRISSMRVLKVLNEHAEVVQRYRFSPLLFFECSFCFTPAQNERLRKADILRSGTDATLSPVQDE